jgi:DNA replication protein DnaC
LTTSLPRIIPKIEEKEYPVCNFCGEDLGRQVTLKGEEIWSCFSNKCKDRIQKEKEEFLVKLKKEHPERFMVEYGVPKKHLSKSLDNFKGNSKVVAICKKYSLQTDKSLLLIGPCGSGKTHLAVSILKSMVENNIIGSERASTSKLGQAVFITTPELLLEIRETFSKSPPKRRDEDGWLIEGYVTETDVIKKYANIDFLIMDDLGSEKVTEWAVTTLYLIIDRRNRSEKATVFTTNLNLKEIESQLNTRIASRLSDCEIIQLNMPDYRKKRNEAIARTTAPK